MSKRIFHPHVLKAIPVAVALAFAAAAPVGAAPKPEGFRTSEPAMLELSANLPSGAKLTPIISSGDEIGGFLFEGLPDGVGLRPGPAKGTVDVYVAHEQSTVPFRSARDFYDSSISALTLSSKGGPRQGNVLGASVALGADEGFLRFCSANMAGPNEGLDDYVFFTGEETDDIVDGVQRGFAVVLNTDTGEHTAVPGMGRLNHENTMIIPGGWDRLAMLTTDDTFRAPSSQLYMYMADDQDAIFADEGELYAFRVTGSDGTPLAAPGDPFNGANDYLDVAVGESMQGEFIAVPEAIAKGDQTALEDWSNDNNAFQAIRLEDLAVDKNDPRVVYIADTGASRVNPNPDTGRLHRPGGAVGMADNGRVWKMVLNEDDPTIVDSFSIFADGDAVNSDVYVPFTSPDNVDTSKKSLMVQEDADSAQIWQHRFNQNSWRSVATVSDPDSESSGIVDASKWFGQGAWILTVQGHGANVLEDTTTELGTLIKRESGQVLLMRIPAS